MRSQLLACLACLLASSALAELPRPERLFNPKRFLAPHDLPLSLWQTPSDRFCKRGDQHFLRLTTPYGRFYIERGNYFAAIDLESREAPKPAAAIQALPTGSRTNSLPSPFQTFLHEGKTCFYAAGHFYSYHDEGGFISIEPPIGAKLRQLPAEAKPSGAHYQVGNANLVPVNEYGTQVYLVSQ